MKILYAGYKYDYGKPEQGFSFEHYNFYDTFVKMDNGQHEIQYFPYDEIMQKQGRTEMNFLLEKAVDKFKPDLTFFILFTDEFDKEILKRISSSGKTKTVVWMSDDHWRFDNYSKYWAECFNWVVTTDSEAVSKYKKIGFENVIKSQWACNHFLYKPFSSFLISNYQHDVSFVGQPHGNRRQVIQKIKNLGIKIDAFGAGWQNGRIPQEKMIEVFALSKINLNLNNSSVGIYSLKGLAHLFLKKKNGLIVFQGLKDIVSNFKMAFGGVREQIKGRNFEVPGCGGFLLTGPADNLSEYYKDGKEIVIFNNQQDLIDKIKYYLDHDEERKKIAQAGYERTLREHTYERRFQDIFKIIGLK